MLRPRLNRRELLGAGAIGLSLPTLFNLRHLARSAEHSSAGRARSCLMLYCWGGMSHHETFDLKPDAPVEYRGEFDPIATRVLSRRLHVIKHRQIDEFDDVGEAWVRSISRDEDDQLRPFPVQVDGDYIGEHTELRFSVEPGALTVVA